MGAAAALQGPGLPRLLALLSRHLPSLPTGSRGALYSVGKVDGGWRRSLLRTHLLTSTPQDKHKQPPLLKVPGERVPRWKQ